MTYPLPKFPQNMITKTMQEGCKNLTSWFSFPRINQPKQKRFNLSKDKKCVTKRTNRIICFKSLFIVLILVLVTFSNAAKPTPTSSENLMDPQWFFSTGSNSSNIDVSDDGQYIVVGVKNQGIILFNKLGSILWNYELPVNTHWSYISTQSMKISSNSNYIAVGGMDNTLYLFDINGTIVWKKNLQHNVNVVSFSEDETRLCAGTQSGTLFSFSIDENLLQWQYDCESPIQSISISLNGDKIAVGDSSGHTYLFDNYGNKIWSYDLMYGDYVLTDISRDGSKVISSTDDRSDKHGCALAFFSASTDGKFGWDYTDGTPQWYHHYSSPRQDIRDISLSNSGDFIYCCGSGIATSVYDTEGRILQNNFSQSNSIAISEDGEYIACGKEMLYYYSSYSSRPLFNFQLSTQIKSISISNSGNVIGISCNNGDIYVFKGISHPKIFSINYTKNIDAYYQKAGDIVFGRGTHDIDCYIIINESDGSFNEDYEIKINDPDYHISVLPLDYVIINGKMAKHFMINIDNNSQIGKFNLIINLLYCNTIIDQIQEEIFIIFNSSAEGTPEYVVDPEERMVFIQNTYSVWWSILDDNPPNTRTTSGRAKTYKTEHFTNLVFNEHSINIVNGLTDPEQVAKKLNAHLHSFLTFKENVLFHSFSDMIINNSGYCECSSWSNALVAMLRSIGIAARPVTNDCDARYSEWYFDTATELYINGTWKVILGRAGKEAPVLNRQDLQYFSPTWTEEKGDVIITANHLWYNYSNELNDSEVDYTFDRFNSRFDQIRPWVDSLSNEYWGDSYKIPILNKIVNIMNGIYPNFQINYINLFTKKIISDNTLSNLFSSDISTNNLLDYKRYNNNTHTSNSLSGESNYTGSLSYNININEDSTIKTPPLSKITKDKNMVVSSENHTSNQITDTLITNKITDPNDLPEIKIISPKGGEEFKEYVSIKWSIENSENYSIPLLNLYYSYDGGITWISIITNLTSDYKKSFDINNGEYLWNFSKNIDGTYKLKFEAIYENTIILNITHCFLKTSIHNTDVMPCYLNIYSDENLINFLRDDEDVTIEAGFNTGLSYFSPNIYADFSCFGLGSSIPPDYVDGFSAYWNLKGIKCVPENESITIDCTIGNDGMNKSITVDNTPPIVEIISPNDALYIKNREVIPSKIPFIIGAPVIQLYVSDISGIKKIDYYINDDMKLSTTSTTWTINERLIGSYLIRVIAYDYTNHSNNDTKKIFVINM